MMFFLFWQLCFFRLPCEWNLMDLVWRMSSASGGGRVICVQVYKQKVQVYTQKGHISPPILPMPLELVLSWSWIHIHSQRSGHISHRPHFTFSTATLPVQKRRAAIKRLCEMDYLIMTQAGKISGSSRGLHSSARGVNQSLLMWQASSSYVKFFFKHFTG